MKFTKRYPEGPLCEDYEANTAKPTLGQPKTCDGREELVVDTVSEDAQGDEEETAEHTGLALEHLKKVALVNEAKVQLIYEHNFN